MSRTLKRLQSLGAKVGAFALSGALALSMTPAVALANDGLTSAQIATASSGALPTVTDSATAPSVYSYEHSDKGIVAEYGDPLGSAKVKEVARDTSAHTVQYMAYAHSDGSHYKSYSLYTKLTTDENGVLTSIDLTSGNDTFAGAWGYKGGDRAVPVEKLLPTGVDFSVTKDDDGNYVPKLSGDALSTYGYKLSSVTLYSTNANMTTDAIGVDRSAGGTQKTASAGITTAAKPGKGDTETTPQYGINKSPELKSDGAVVVPSKATVKKADGSETEEIDDYYNLVKCTYTIGLGDKTGDKIDFNTYFTVGAHANLANQYLTKTLQPTTYDDTSYNETNRDGWTGIMGTLMLRQLASWGAHLANPSRSTDNDGEIGGIDTVSGATKTSNAFVDALYKEYDRGGIKGVAEDVTLTIDGDNTADGAEPPAINVNDTPQDGTTVVKNSDGTYTVNANHRLYGGGRLHLLNVYLYGLGGQTVGTTGVKTLAKESFYDKEDSYYKYVRSYNDDDTTGKADIPDKIKKLVPYNSDVENGTTLDAVNDEFATLTYGNSGWGSNNNAMPITLTVKKSNVTHVVFKYLLGHATFAIAYDLENMAKAGKVNEQINNLNNSPALNDLASARASYNALPYDVKPFVTNFSKLKTAESKTTTEAGNYAEAVAAAEAELAKTRTVSDFTIAPGSYTYTGAQIKPAVTAVEAADGSTVDASHYTVSYSNNTNAGSKATVTVKGTGVGWSGSVSKTFTIAPAASSIKLADQTLTYTGKALAYSGAVTKTGSTGKVTYSYFSDAACTKAVSAANVKNAGTYYVKAAVAAAGNYAAATSNAAKLTVGKASQTIKAAKTYSVKKKQVKKKSRKIAVKFQTTTGDGKITYSSAKSGKVSIAKNGKVTVKKGAKKKTYTLKVKVTAAESANYAKTTQTVKLKVKVK